MFISAPNLSWLSDVHDLHFMAALFAIIVAAAGSLAYIVVCLAPS